MAKLPEILNKLSALPAQLGKTQKGIAGLVGVSPQAVSNWMSPTDDSVPSSESYWRLGELVGYPDCLWFWEQAGMGIDMVLPAVARLLEERGQLARSKMVDVPRLRRSAGRIQREEPTAPVNAELLSNPGSGAYWVVDPPASPPIHRPSTRVFLDTSAVDAGDVRPLFGKVVLVESTGQSPSNFLSMLDAGVHMGRLAQKSIGSGEYGHWYGILAPCDGPPREWRSGEPPDRVCLSHWELFQAKDKSNLTKRDSSHGGEVLDDTLIRLRAREEFQPFPGITILGRVVDWYRP